MNNILCYTVQHNKEYEYLVNFAKLVGNTLLPCIKYNRNILFVLNNSLQSLALNNTPSLFKSKDIFKINSYLTIIKQLPLSKQNLA